MKFCPQCGTTFEPEARFCLECGFDKLTVEPVSPAVNLYPGVYVPETVVAQANHSEVPDSQMKMIQACPKCGSTIETGERFCPECGFDTSVSYETTPKSQEAIPQSIVEEIITPVNPVNVPVTPDANEPACPQCGTGIDTDERFCPQCGYDTISDKDKNDIKPEPVAASPVFETPLPPKPVILSPPPEPTHSAAPVFTQPTRSGEPLLQPKKKKTRVWIFTAIIGIGVLGAAGWFVFSKYSAAPNDTPADNVTNTKPMSLMDQALAKQKPEVQQQNTQQNTTNQDDMAIPDESDNDIASKVILEVGRKEEPRNKNPKNPTKLTIHSATMITKITTDHYNDGMGTPRGGTITIKDHLGIVIGNYKAFGQTGKNGTPSAKWVAEPNIMLGKGTYFISDSDIATWSKNLLGNGFVVVEGYEVE